MDEEPPPGKGSSEPAAIINLIEQPGLEVPASFGREMSVAAGQGGAGPPKPPTADVLVEIDPGFWQRPYDPEESRDTARQTISLWLIGLLCGIVVLSFVALFAGGAATGFTDGKFYERLGKLLDVLVGPVITLLASAVGFYFGSKQADKGSSTAPRTAQNIERR